MKSWWSGDSRVEPYMLGVNQALDRSGLEGDKRVDVYNRAYEAVYAAIKNTEKQLSIKNVLAPKDKSDE